MVTRSTDAVHGSVRRSDLSRSALAKAKLYAIALERAPRALTDELLAGERPALVAVSVIPENDRYAEERGWIAADEEFSVTAIATHLEEQVASIAPTATFERIRIERGATSGTIGLQLRQRADALGASDVFIGSENAGRIVMPVSSVGGSVAADDRFDVHIVRHELPSTVRNQLRET